MASLPHVVCMPKEDIISDDQASITPMSLQQAINCISDPSVSNLYKI